MIEMVLIPMLTVIAAVAGFLLEWRRSGRDAANIDALASRLADAERRLMLIESRHERIDRAR